jgi:hypothetical protein
MKSILKWRPELAKEQNLDKILLIFTKKIQQHIHNLQAFIGTYGLDNVSPDTIGEICIALAKHTQEFAFHKIHKQDVMLKMSLPVQHRLLASVLHFSDDEIFHNLYAGISCESFTEQSILHCMSVAASFQKLAVFRMLLRLLSKRNLSSQAQAHILSESAKFSDTAMFFEFCRLWGAQVLNEEVLGKVLGNAAEYSNHEIAQFVFQHDLFPRLDEYYLEQALIKACNSQNIEVIRRLFALNRLGDLEEDCFAVAFYGGVIANENLEIAKIFKEHHYFDSLPEEYLLELLEVFGSKQHLEACQLVLEDSIVNKLQSNTQLGSMLQTLVDQDASVTIDLIIKSRLLDRQSYLMQSLFDQAFKSKHIETLRVILTCSKRRWLDVRSIIPMAKNIPSSGDLEFFENFGRMFVRNISGLFPSGAETLKQDLITYLSKVSFSALQPCVEQAFALNRLDVVRPLLTGVSLHKELNGWLFTRETLEKALVESCKKDHKDIVELLLGRACKGIISKICIEKLLATPTLSKEVLGVLSRGLHSKLL